MAESNSVLEVQIWDEFGGASLADAKACVTSWSIDRIHSLMKSLDAGLPILFRLSRACLNSAQTIEVATAIADIVSSEVIARFGTSATGVEIEPPLVAKIHPGHSVRAMLPHHDAHHSSFLTPSRIDAPDFNAKLRFFGRPDSVPTHSTILYSGFVVEVVGDAEGITTFYDWISMIRDAFHLATGRVEYDIVAMAKWFGQNIVSAHAKTAELGMHYLSLGAALGATERAFNLSHVEAERDFGPEEYDQVQELAHLIEDCPCGACVTGRQRLMCRALDVTLGVSAPDTLAEYGVSVKADAGDFLIWCNPSLLHGALHGGLGRTLIPVTVATTDLESPGYERWLFRLWRRPLYRAKGAMYGNGSYYMRVG